MPTIASPSHPKSIQSQRVPRRAYRLLGGAGIAPRPSHPAGTPAALVLTPTVHTTGTPAAILGSPHGSSNGHHAGGSAPMQDASLDAGVAGAKLNSYPDAPPGTTFANSGGPTIGNVDVQLVFWGKEWANAPPIAPSDIQSRVDTILRSPYLSKLTQYGCSGTGRIRGTTFVTDQDPPSVFNDGSVQGFVTGLIDDETLPEPDEDWDLFVCVFMPTYVTYGPGGATGAHSAVVWSDYDLFDVDNDRVRLAWIGNPGGVGAVDTITATFSHELVEACTDPETTANPAWRQVPCTNPTQCEIGDVCSSTTRIFGVQVQAYWSQADGACVIPVPDAGDWSGLFNNWKPVGGFFPVKALITCVSRNPGQLDLFVCGNDGRVYTSWWNVNAEWSGINDTWRPIGGFFPPGAPIAAVARTPNNLDLFVCGNDGRVYTAWWNANADWSGVNDNWRSIGGIFPPGAPVSAVARTANNLDVFVCGNDGRVFTSWWSSAGDWSGVNDNWRSIGGFFPVGAPVSAVSRGPNNLDLFVCGNDGRVYTSWWYLGVDWSGVNDNWRSIGGFFPAGTPVAAVARTPNNLDLFISGNDGRVYTSWWYLGVDWSGVNDNWRSIGGFFPVGAPLAAVARTAVNLDVFVCGNDGRVYTSWWYLSVDWSGVNDNWRSIGGFFPVGAPLSAVARTGSNLDVFVSGNDGRVYTSWWPSA